MITLDSFCALGEPQRALVQDVRSGRAPHATLITGIAGTGKRTLARLLACALLCRSDGDRPCMQCKDCRRAQAGTHPDLLMPSVREKDRSIKVDDLRAVIQALSYHAAEGGRRVVLLENAQRMTVQAQNALLKSLEEPDGETTFLLTASGETELLPTVRSRCRVVRVQPWAPAEIERELLRRQVDGAQAQTIAALCGGSLGRALDMYENPAFLSQRTLCERTFFSVRSAQDVPPACALLRDKKDDADALLDLLEQQGREYLLHSMNAGSAPKPSKDALCAHAWEQASPRALENVLSAVLLARRQRTCNVSWQAIADKLLYTISEELN